MEIKQRQLLDMEEERRHGSDDDDDEVQNGEAGREISACMGSCEGCREHGLRKEELLLEEAVSSKDDHDAICADATS